MSENKSSSSLLKSIIYGVVFGVLTGVLWAYLNPVPIIPGMIHLRLFSFIPPVVGIIFGMKAGFFSGYIGTVVWGLLAGTFIPIHSLIGDGIGVGFTGLIPAMMVGAKNSLADIAEKKNIMWKSLLWSVLAGVIMIIISCGSLAILGIFDFWWGVFWIGIADIPTICLTPFIAKYLAKKLQNVNSIDEMRS